MWSSELPSLPVGLRTLPDELSSGSDTSTSADCSTPLGGAFRRTSSSGSFNPLEAYGLLPTSLAEEVSSLLPLLAARMHISVILLSPYQSPWLSLYQLPRLLSWPASLGQAPGLMARPSAVPPFAWNCTERRYIPAAPSSLSRGHAHHDHLGRPRTLFSFASALPS